MKMKQNRIHFLSHSKISPVSKFKAPNVTLWRKKKKRKEERKKERKKERRKEGMTEGKKKRSKERTQIIVISTQVNNEKKFKEIKYKPTWGQVAAIRGKKQT